MHEGSELLFSHVPPADECPVVSIVTMICSPTSHAIHLFVNMVKPGSKDLLALQAVLLTNETPEGHGARPWAHSS
jgi:hypothetical protein